MILSLVIIIWLVLISSCQAADEDNEWISSTAIPSLLRFNRDGQKVSSDWADYAKWDCTGKGSSRSCSLDTSSMDDFSSGSSSDGIPSYIDGVAMYAAISAAAGVLIVVGTFLYLLYAIFLKMCKCCGCCAIKPETKASITPANRYILNMVLLGVFLAVMFVIVILWYVLGLTQLLSGTSDVPDGPLGAAQLIYRFSLASEALYVSLASTVVLPTLRTVNSTFTAVVDWRALTEDARAINASMHKLPNIELMRSTLTEIQYGTGNLSEIIDLTLGESDIIEAARDDTLNNSYIVLADLLAANVSLENLSNTTRNGQVAVAELQGYVDDWFGAGGSESYSFADTDGIIDSLQHDIQVTSRNDTPGYGFPTVAKFVNVTTGDEATTEKLIAQEYDSQKLGELHNLNVKLHDIYDAITLLPNFTVTAQTLQTLNVSLSEMLSPGGVLDDMDTFFADFKRDLNALPDTDNITVHVNDLFDSIDRLDTANARSEVSAMDPYVGALPGQLRVLLNEVGQLEGAVLGLVDPLYDLMVIQVQDFNRTIMKLPIDTTEEFETINKTLYDAAEISRDSVTEINKALDSLDSDINITDYLRIIDDAQGTIDDETASLNQTEILNLIASLSINTTFNATENQIKLRAARQSARDSLITQELIDSYYDLEIARHTLEEYLERAVGEVGDTTSDGRTLSTRGEYWRLEQGVCAADTTIYCSSDSDCSSVSSTCSDIGKYRCSPNGDGAYGVTSCSEDADCSAATSAGSVTSYCLADSSRAYELHYSLLAFTSESNTTSFNQTDWTVVFTETRRTVTELDLDQVSLDLADVQSSIDDADTVSYTTDMNSVIDSLEDEGGALDFDELTGSLVDGKAGINEIDYAELDDSLEDMEDIVEDGKDLAEDSIGALSDLEDFFYQTSGLQSNFARLERSYLQTISNERGFGPLVIETGHNFEDAVDALRPIFANVSAGFDRIEVSNRIKDDLAPTLDRATGNPASGFVDVYAVGALYYLLQLSNNTADEMINARDPQQDTIMYNKDGDRYEDGKYCVTRYCFEQQQKAMEEGDDNSDFPLAPETTAGLLIVPIVLIWLVALCGVFCPFTGCTPYCKKCPATWMLCLIIAIVPWYLIFTGPFMSLLIIANDSCESGPGVLTTYIDAMGDDLCDVLGGNGSLTECAYRGNDIDVTVDIKAMTGAFLGDVACSGKNEDDPFYNPISTLGFQLRNRTKGSAEDRMSRDNVKRIRQPVKDIVITAATGTADVTADFLDDIGDTVITCENVADILSSMKDPICYSGLGPATWFVAMLYLAAWTLCCCGIPTACCLQHHYMWLEIENKQRATEDAEAAEDDADDADEEVEHRREMELLAQESEGSEVDEASRHEDEYDGPNASSFGEEPVQPTPADLTVDPSLVARQISANSPDSDGYVPVMVNARVVALQEDEDDTDGGMKLGAAASAPPPVAAADNASYKIVDRHAATPMSIQERLRAKAAALENARKAGSYEPVNPNANP